MKATEKKYIEFAKLIIKLGIYNYKSVCSILSELEAFIDYLQLSEDDFVYKVLYRMKMDIFDIVDKTIKYPSHIDRYVNALIKNAKSHEIIKDASEINEKDISIKYSCGQVPEHDDFQPKVKSYGAIDSCGSGGFGYRSSC